ncbi:EVE domain-containing protein [Reinekea sp.]|jgi:predicted RNA-binding protein with PUA-like domain|uniref:EVE domain-containing protein n=1 Tax=Reinekea sp. TaxID=1970455 RepID=UPI002A841340|nr:EVE domain-containing protein [Reinekea sp.]
MSASIWLLKTEPDQFSMTDLAMRGSSGERWNGIRNYQARNFLRTMQVGDLALIYHSTCSVPAIVGMARVISPPYEDADALDPGSAYFDAKSTTSKVRWSVVDIQFSQHWTHPVTLAQLKMTTKLSDMAVLRQARLSISPVLEVEYRLILTLLAQNESQSTIPAASL